MQEAALDQAKHVATSGLSFDIVAGSGAFPPLEVLNDFFGCGHDDLDYKDATIEWEPFALTDREYDELLRWWQARHPNARPDALGTRGADFRDWFGRAVRITRRPRG